MYSLGSNSHVNQRKKCRERIKKEIFKTSLSTEEKQQLIKNINNDLLTLGYL